MLLLELFISSFDSDLLYESTFLKPCGACPCTAEETLANFFANIPYEFTCLKPSGACPCTAGKALANFFAKALFLGSAVFLRLAIFFGLPGAVSYTHLTLPTKRIV